VSPKEAKAKPAGGLDESIAEIHKRFGDGAIMTMGDDFHANVTWLSTGVVSLDLALGGGLPLGRMAEVFGPESSGKSTLALHIVAEAQRAGLYTAYIDSEHAMDPTYAEALGVDTGKLLFSQPDNGEQALEIVDLLLDSGESGVIIVDSVAALTPRAEIEGEMGDAHVGLHARMMAQALRKLNSKTNEAKVLIVWINQLREKIGVIYGSPEVTPGGRALKFYSSVRLDVRRTETVREAGEATSNKTRVKVVKNKCAVPFRQAEFEIQFGHGVDKFKDMLNAGIDLGVVDKAGSWLTLPSGERAQGVAQAKELLIADPEGWELLDAKVREAAK
jgi:recombination protein RecA